MMGKPVGLRVTGKAIITDGPLVWTRKHQGRIDGDARVRRNVIGCDSSSLTLTRHA